MESISITVLLILIYLRLVRIDDHVVDFVKAAQASQKGGEKDG